MDVDSCYQLGYIIKPHGLQGEVNIYLDTDNPMAYKDLESVFILQDNQLVPFFIDKIKISANKAILSLEESRSIETAIRLKGAKLYLPLDFLPELDDDQYYFHEIIDFMVQDQILGDLGPVASVYDIGPQDIMAFTCQGKEVLLPITEDTVIKVDKVRKTISVKLPAGLLDIYTSDEEEHED